jgi:hypothetical protein
MPAGLAPGKDFSFDSIADGEPVTGFGDLICSSIMANTLAGTNPYAVLDAMGGATAESLGRRDGVLGSGREAT